MKFIVHTDGGARGNPGKAAVGVVIEEVISDKGKVIIKTKITEFGKRIGETTNNVAEYLAVVNALQEIKNLRQRRISLWLKKSPPKADQPLAEKIKIEKTVEIQIFLDSTLVVNQLNGRFKVKDGKLRELLMQVRMLEQEAGGVITYHAIPREQNVRADLLVNQVLDGERSLVT